MDFRLKSAKYQQAMAEWELQTDLLGEMQRALVEGNVLLTLPHLPATTHQHSSSPVKRDDPDWPLIFSRAARNGWSWVLFVGVLGVFTTRSWMRWRQGRDLTARRGGKADADEEISWA